MIFSKQWFDLKISQFYIYLPSIFWRTSNLAFWISCICSSLNFHSYFSLASIIIRRLLNCSGSVNGGNEASQARLSLARSIISTSAIPAGRPRPWCKAARVKISGASPGTTLYWGLYRDRYTFAYFQEKVKLCTTFILYYFHLKSKFISIFISYICNKLKIDTNNLFIGNDML